MDPKLGEYTTEEVRALARELRTRGATAREPLLQFAADVLLASADGRVFPAPVREAFNKVLGQL